MPDYRFLIYLEGGGMLPQHLKLDYIPKIGDVFKIGHAEYQVLVAGKVEGIVYKMIVRKKAVFLDAVTHIFKRGGKK